MATTVKKAFQEFKQKLEITDLQQSEVSTRQKHIRSVIEQNMKVKESFLIGSYARHTMISPLGENDIDIFIVLDQAYCGDLKPKALLKLVKSLLAESFSRSQIVTKPEAINLKFSDFNADVVAAFEKESGNYIIPSKCGKKWIKTNPKIHNDSLTEANKKHDGMLIPMIKMLKAWNRKNDNAFLPIYLEFVAIEIFRDYEIKDFGSAMLYFMDKIRNRVFIPVKDPANNQDMPVVLNAKSVKKVLKIVKKDYLKVLEAEVFNYQGRTDEAIMKWAEIFGEFFPAPG